MHLKVERENNLDFLRAICTIAVIITHVTGPYLDSSFTIRGRAAHYIIIFLNSACRFSVPCFVMLSGAFDIANDRNADYRYYYKKVFRKFGIHIIIFSIIYAFYRIAIQFILGSGVENYLLILRDILVGAPYYHLWYVYMMLVVWMFIPILVLVRRRLSFKQFAIITVGFVVWASFGSIQSSTLIKWNIGWGFQYVSLAMLGYVLRANRFVRSKYGVVLIVLGILLGGAIGYLKSFSSNHIGGVLLGTLFDGYLSPLVVLVSVIIYLGGVKCYIKREHFSIVKVSYYVYLIHPIYVDIVGRLEIYLGLDDSLAVVFMKIGSVWIFSIVSSFAYKYIWNKLNERTQFAKRCENALLERLGRLWWD